MVLGDQLGLYRALAEGPQTPDVLAAKHGHRRPLRRGMAARPGRRRLRRLRRRLRHLPPDRRAGLRADRPRRPGLPAGRVPARARRPCTPYRGWRKPSAPARASAGTSTTRTSSSGASDSSGPATPPISSPSGCPPWTASSPSSSPVPRWPTSAAVSAPRRSLMAQALPEQHLHRLRLPRPLRRAGAQERRGPRAGRPGGVRDRRGDDVHRRALRPRRDVRLPARHG